MPAVRYRFHCTDGREVIVDRRGRFLSNAELIWVHAERVAHELMTSGNGKLDWSNWIVDVHDQKGRHALTLAFADVRQFQEAA